MGIAHNGTSSGEREQSSRTSARSDRPSTTGWSRSRGARDDDADGDDDKGGGVQPGEWFGVVAPRCVVTAGVLALAVALVYAARDPNLHQGIVSAGRSEASVAAAGIGRVPFDEVAAGAALDNLQQVARSCTRGLSPQRVTVRVTFAPNGEVVGAQVDERGRIGDEAAACLEALFQQVRVTPYAGEKRTLRRYLDVR